MMERRERCSGRREGDEERRQGMVDGSLVRQS
jgi:hypothetical protein